MNIFKNIVEEIVEFSRPKKVFLKAIEEYEEEPENYSMFDLFDEQKDEILGGDK